MTHVKLESKSFSGRRGRFTESYNLYKVVINGEDGEYYEYEVEADSYGEASTIGESLAAGLLDIQYIEVYQVV
ncbi:MAG: hypothetical protein J5953_13480 [Prevotella sp.]|nr:hypothetical protein [Prevotella sp.]